MNDRDFAVLCLLKDRIEEAERRFPMNAKFKELHRDGWRALCKLKGALGLTPEQMKILSAAPQGGGTNKEEDD
jgi:hypothetical protein